MDAKHIYMLVQVMMVRI